MVVPECLALESERLAESRFGTQVIAATRRNQRQVVQADGRVRVIGAAGLDVQLQRLLEQRLRAIEVSVQPQDRRQVAQADRRLAMLVAQHLAPDVERFAVQRFRALIQALILIDTSELHQRDRDIPVFAEQLATEAERTLQRSAGASVVLVGQDDAEIVERLCDLRTLGTERLLAARERLLEQLLRPVELTEAAIRPPIAVSISACSPGSPARSFWTCAAPASSSARTVGSPETCGSRTDPRSSAGPSAAR